MYSMVPSDSLLAPGLVAAMNTYGWMLVKIVTENSTLYDLVSICTFMITLVVL